MEHRQLGASGLRVPVLALGTATFGGRGIFEAMGSTDLAGARRMLDMCRDAGVSLVDTADEYSGGQAEEIIGEAIHGRRDDVILATKAGMAIGDGPNDAGSSRCHLVRACEASLRRLGTDHIDLYQLHQWDGQTPLEETMEALDTLVRTGKVRYIGASSFAGWQLMKALAIADRCGYQRIVAHQVHYTLEAREAEHELVPVSLDQGVGLLVWSPLAGGLLTGKYRRGQAPEGSRHSTEWWKEPPIRDAARLEAIVDLLVEIGDGHGVSAARVALAWLLGRPGVTSLVIGARTPEQLADNLGAADLRLAPDERTRLDTLSAPPLPYPHWRHALSAPDRLGTPELAVLWPYIPERPTPERE